MNSLFLGALCALACSGQPQFALRNGDKVIFYGDSITDYGLYPALIETFVATRYAKLEVSFLNAGVGGEKTSGGGLGSVDLRLTRDVFAKRPTVVTFMLGMNDAEYRPFDADLFHKFKEGYAHISDRLQANLPAGRIWLFKPTPYDDITKPASFLGGYNGVLTRYADAVSDLALRKGYGLVDLNTPLIELLNTAQNENPDLAQTLVPDRIHPIPEAHLAICATILKAWNASGLVSSIFLSWKSHKSFLRNASLSHWDETNFTVCEDSLPMPIDRKNVFTTLVNRIIGFDDTMNQEILKIEGVPAGFYALRIDGQKVADLTAEELGQGVNLAQLDTPMVRQAQRVFDIVKRLSEVRGVRWRAIELPFAKGPSKERNEVLKSLDRLEAKLLDLRAAEAKPVKHHFMLVPAGQPVPH